MVSPTAATFYFLQIFLKRAAKPSAGNTSAGFPWVKWPQNLLNLTWLYTKASQTFSGTFSGTLLNLTWLCTKASWNLLLKLLRNLEPDLALHQSLPDLLRNLLQNTLNLTWLWHQSLPEPYPQPCWTWPGSPLNPPRPSPEPSEPSPEPRWTWPGACTSAHRSYSGLKTPLAYAVGEKGNGPIPPLAPVQCSLAYTWPSKTRHWLCLRTHLSSRCLGSLAENSPGKTVHLPFPSGGVPKKWSPCDAPTWDSEKLFLTISFIWRTLWWTKHVYYFVLNFMQFWVIMPYWVWSIMKPNLSSRDGFYSFIINDFPRTWPHLAPPSAM